MHSPALVDKKPIYDFACYKEYLAARLSTQGASRGQRSQLAQKIRCKPAFISQVLHGNVHFSMEHAIEIDRFLNHTRDETEFFLLLLQKGKAGSQNLERYYAERMELILRERQKVANQVTGNIIDSETSQRYYTSWVYSAIHVLVLIPGNRTTEKLATRLGISLEATKDAVDFLVKAGLLEDQHGEWFSTSRRVHIAGDSVMINKHHSNWRVRSLNSLDARNPMNLHYSGPIAVSRKNAQLVRSILLKVIKDLEPILAEPDEDDIYGIALDFFAL